MTNEKLTIIDAVLAAHSKNGKCLSKRYINNGTALLWECNNGHKWKTSLAHIRNGSWCPECMKVNLANKFRMKNGVTAAQKIAKKKNGKCLSTKYINNHTKMWWECSKGHRWEATLANIKIGTWCPECAGIKKLSLDVANETAIKMGGKCLSDKYINSETKMTWECACGHIWQAKLGHIRQGHWCPKCGSLETAKKSNKACILKHWKTGSEIVCVASYEKAVVEYFNSNRIDYMWQHKIFYMPPDKSGKIRSYRPDCYLLSEDKWIEIKGYFRQDAKEKWTWFHRKYINSELWDAKKLKELEIL
jgi:hypothetical protein